MRIITGKARGAKLFSLEGEATRPTAERTKEAVFSMIHFDLEGREVLDLFAGSGQLGLEAVSRGAKHVTLIDNAKPAIDIINRNVTKCRFEEYCTVLKCDYNDYLRSKSNRMKYDIVLLDPPYAQKLIPSSLEGLLNGNFLKPTTIIVCESADPADVFGNRPYLKDKFDVLKTAKYGIAYITLLVPCSNDTEAEEEK